MSHHPESETRHLQQLLADWKAAVGDDAAAQPPPYHGPDLELTRITEKTDDVGPGACFVARVRTTSDGHPYIGKAIEKGACLILAQRPASDVGVTVPGDVVYWQVPDTAETLAWLAAAWEGFPSRHLVTVGITGTDGKTSTGNILLEILKRAGLKTGMLSTLKAVIGDREEPLALHVTTPEAPVVQRQLRRMVDAGLSHCLLEVTSHGLAQHRVTAVDFDVAVVTNITHEHLDYHGGYEAYYAAKSRLFEMLQSQQWQLEPHNQAKKKVSKTAVLNRDDQSYRRLAGIPASIRLTYGIYHHADVYATDIVHTTAKTRFNLHLPGNSGRTSQQPISSSLVGEFNVYNMLAAATAAYALGVTPEAILRGLQAVRGISGRMQRIDGGQPFPVVVDFAHTPNALEKAIAAARRMVTGSGKSRGRVITVFGSAGKRDVEKRRLMAQISARDADLTVLTAEDPRTESLDDILAVMAEGCRRQGGVEGETFWRVPDRGQAIYFALSLARSQDLVLICGKGHEQSMCFGTIEYPWDDREATRLALDAFLKGAPMPDLGLPTFDPEVPGT